MAAITSALLGEFSNRKLPSHGFFRKHNFGRHVAIEIVRVLLPGQVRGYVRLLREVCGLRFADNEWIRARAHTNKSSTRSTSLKMRNRKKTLCKSFFSMLPCSS